MTQPLSSMSLRDLLRHRDEILRQLEDREHALMAELRLCEQLIARFDTVRDKPYATVKWPRDAILLCLTRNKAWMTKDQIQADLERGGFVFNPSTFRSLLGQGLRYHARTGRIARRDEHGNLLTPQALRLNERYPNEQYGLADWVDNPSIPTLEPKE